VLLRCASIPNVVAVKYEVGRPGIAGDLEFWKMIRGTGLLFSDPLEAHSPLTVEMFGQQWMGTSNYEYWGGAVPEYFKLLLEGKSERAMEIYWRINPAVRPGSRYRPHSRAPTSSIGICGNIRVGCTATMAA